MSGFASRLSPEEFSSDARTAVFLEWPARAERTERIAELWVPERLFERLVHLGAAYELHFAQLINLRRESWLEGRQCESLAYELELVLDLRARRSGSSIRGWSTPRYGCPCESRGAWAEIHAESSGRVIRRKTG